jgi:hypothetical protein
MDGEGIVKLRNPEARTKTPPRRLRVTKAMGRVRRNHHRESLKVLWGFRYSSALQEA